MVYIFYGLSYKNNYQKALNFAHTITKLPLIINENIINYNKEDIELFLYYFSLPASAEEPNVIMIEYPENIKALLMQSFLVCFENIPPFHTVILITNQLQKIQKTIISRAILFLNEESNEEEKMYHNFIQALTRESLINKTIEEIIDNYNITEKNTIDVSLLLLQSNPDMSQKFHEVLKKYLPFINNSYYLYWKIIYLLLNQK